MGVSDELPRITVPHVMYANLQKQRAKNEARKVKKRKPVFKTPLVIDCKRSSFNHHLGQTYGDFGRETLASYGWMKRKSAGDSFTILCHDKVSKNYGRLCFADL